MTEPEWRDVSALRAELNSTSLMVDYHGGEIVHWLDTAPESTHDKPKPGRPVFLSDALDLDLVANDPSTVHDAYLLLNWHVKRLLRVEAAAQRVVDVPGAGGSSVERLREALGEGPRHD